MSDVLGYVMGNNFLVERIRMRHPLPSVRIATRKAMNFELATEGAPMQQACFDYDDYPACFRSIDGSVIIYDGSRPIDFMETALRHTGGELRFKEYKIATRLSYNNREVIEDIVKKAISHAIECEDRRADSVIAKEAAREIDISFRQGI